MQGIVDEPTGLILAGPAFRMDMLSCGGEGFHLGQRLAPLRASLWDPASQGTSLVPGARSPHMCKSHSRQPGPSSPSGNDNMS